MTVILLRQTADAAPFIGGADRSTGGDVLAMAVTGPEGREAVVRPQQGAPLQAARLDW